MHLFDVRLVLLASFLTSSTSRAERSAEFCSPLAPPLSRLSHYFILSHSVYLTRVLGFYLSRGLTQIPWITQTRWLKPSGITTGKRNLVLGIRLLYLPIMVVICPGKYSHSSPGIFSLLRYQETPRILKMRTVAPFLLYTAACASLCVSDLFLYPALEHPPAYNNKILRKENFYLVILADEWGLLENFILRIIT